MFRLRLHTYIEIHTYTCIYEAPLHATIEAWTCNLYTYHRYIHMKLWNTTTSTKRLYFWYQIHSAHIEMQTHVHIYIYICVFLHMYIAPTPQSTLFSFSCALNCFCCFCCSCSCKPLYIESSVCMCMSYRLWVCVCYFNNSFGNEIENQQLQYCKCICYYPGNAQVQLHPKKEELGQEEAAAAVL